MAGNSVWPKCRMLEEHTGDSVNIMWNINVKVRLEMEVRKLFIWKTVLKLFE